MIIRNLLESDLEQLKQIHERYYNGEFSFPDFNNKFLPCFAVINGETIISAGGVRLIAESVIITNKNASTRQRREALYNMLQASLFTCGRTGFDQLHCFIQDDNWKNHLIDVGFNKCKGEALFISV